MAITKLMNMKENKGFAKSRHLKNAINYILDEKKTVAGLFVNSNCGINGREIYDSMMDSKRQFGKEWGRQGYHFVISFLPGEADEELAYRTAEKFVSRYLKDEYDYVYAVHNDKGHMHAHIIFNSVSYSGYKYHYGKGEWETNIQAITDDICREQGLSTILLKEGGKGKSYGEWVAEKEGRMTWRSAIRIDLDAAVRVCRSYPELLEYMRQNGYIIREGYSKRNGEYISFRPSHSKKAFRSYTLGKDYSVIALKDRISLPTVSVKPVLPPKLKICRLPRHCKPASVYQLNHVRTYYRVKHFYNYKGWQYRKDILRIEELYRGCCCLLKNNIRSPEELERRLDILQGQEKELYKFSKELQVMHDIAVDKDDIKAENEAILAETTRRLQRIKAEKRLLRKIHKRDGKELQPADDIAIGSLEKDRQKRR